MRDLIVRAISERRVISLDYTAGQRRVEPHAFGYSRNGDLLLRAYQTDGASESGEHQWWKLFRIDRVRSLNVDDVMFDGARPEYKRGDKHLGGGIIAQL
jgi:predicted DNA-binding transcriptional regulator YafY